MNKQLIFLLISFICFGVFSGCTQLYLSQGNKYFKQGKYEYALCRYNKTIVKDSLHSRSWANSGICYIKLNQVDKGIECFKTVKRINPKSSQICLLIGDAYALKKDFESAILYYEEANGLGIRKDEMFYFNLGSYYYFGGYNQLAIKYLEKSIEFNPSFSEPLNNLAWAYLDINPSKSCEFFRKAYEIDSIDTRNVNNLGYAYLMCGELEIAHGFFLKAKELDPKNSFVYRNLGLYYKEKGEKELSCKYLQQAIDLDIITMWGKYYILDLLNYCNVE